MGHLMCRRVLIVQKFSVITDTAVLTSGEGSRSLSVLLGLGLLYEMHVLTNEKTSEGKSQESTDTPASLQHFYECIDHL